MISNLALIDNPMVRKLGTRMMDLPHVVDIRFFPTLKTELKELAGEDVVSFQAVTLIGTEWRHVFIIVPKDIYSDEKMHNTAVQTMANKIAQCWNEEPMKIIEEPPIPEVIVPEPVPTETVEQPADQPPTE